MILQEFLHRINLEAFYEGIGWEPLRHQGSEDVGQCLDLWGLHKHGDRTGKFAINREKRVANCWVCGGMSFLTLAMETQNLDEEKAIEWLYQFVDNEVNIEDEIEAILNEPEPEEEKPLPHYNVRILDRIWEGHQEAQLVFAAAYPEFQKRGISREVVDYFKCGIGFLRNPDGNFDRYLILPHFWGNNLVGWQGRKVNDAINGPKYRNSPDFPRDRTVWGYHFALRQTEAPIIVESVMTALYLISEGYSAIATFGAQINNKQLQLLRVFQQGVILAPDNDPPGEVWRERAIQHLERYIPVLSVSPVEKPGGDLGDLDAEELSTHLCEITVA